MVNYNFKCVVIGDSGVGKTSLLTRFVREEFRGTGGTRSTISAALLERRVDLGNGDAAMLEIWDTAGQERFRSLNTPMYYRGAAGAILVYDATDSSSFDHVPGWYSQLRMMGEKGCVVALCASKLDLAEKRAVEAREAQAFADSQKIPVFRETSAKTGHNVEDLFLALSKAMVKAKLANGGVAAVGSTGKVKIDMPDPRRQQSNSGCC